MGRTESPLPFAQLQRRIGRKTLGQEDAGRVPVVLVAYDLLEDGGEDVRAQPLRGAPRAAGPAPAIDAVRPRLRLSPACRGGDLGRPAHSAREQARERGAEGLMLKRLSTRVRRRPPAGRLVEVEDRSATRVDAVLIYAQPGSGRRAGLYTDYTFGVWEGRQLVPFAKAYSGLTDEEIRQVDAFVRRNTLEKFGPVRTVKPELVFELALRGDPALHAAQVGHRGAFPAHGPLAHRQEGRGRRYDRDGAGAPLRPRRLSRLLCDVNSSLIPYDGDGEQG